MVMTRPVNKLRTRDVLEPPFCGREKPMDQSTNRRWLVIWIALIVVVVVPWGALERRAHWERVAWIPFVSPPVEISDVTGNVFFYLPYGIVAAGEVAETLSPVLSVTASAILLSLAGEFTQVFSNSRYPSMTDVTCNAVGAFIGASWARRRHRAQIKIRPAATER
jgi:glycopeptide antibiotics resistance protein